MSTIFSTLPSDTGAGNALTYYIAVTVDETTTYTSWVVTKVQNSDNEYVQYRLMSDTFNTTVSNWQGTYTFSGYLENLEDSTLDNITARGIYRTVDTYDNFGILLVRRLSAGQYSQLLIQETTEGDLKTRSRQCIYSQWTAWKENIGMFRKLLHTQGQIRKTIETGTYLCNPALEDGDFTASSILIVYNDGSTITQTQYGGTNARIRTSSDLGSTWSSWNILPGINEKNRLAEITNSRLLLGNYASGSELNSKLETGIWQGNGSIVSVRRLSANNVVQYRLYNLIEDNTGKVHFDYRSTSDNGVTWTNWLECGFRGGFALSDVDSITERGVYILNTEPRIMTVYTYNNNIYQDVYRADKLGPIVMHREKVNNIWSEWQHTNLNAYSGLYKSGDNHVITFGQLYDLLSPNSNGDKLIDKSSLMVSDIIVYVTGEYRKYLQSTVYYLPVIGKYNTIYFESTGSITYTLLKSIENLANGNTPNYVNGTQRVTLLAGSHYVDLKGANFVAISRTSSTGENVSPDVIKLVNNSENETIIETLQENGLAIKESSGLINVVNPKLWPVNNVKYHAANEADIWIDKKTGFMYAVYPENDTSYYETSGRIGMSIFCMATPWNVKHL